MALAKEAVTTNPYAQLRLPLAHAVSSVRSGMGDDEVRDDERRLG